MDTASPITEASIHPPLVTSREDHWLADDQFLLIDASSSQLGNRSTRVSKGCLDEDISVISLLGIMVEKLEVVEIGRLVDFIVQGEVAPPWVSLSTEELSEGRVEYSVIGQ